MNKSIISILLVSLFTGCATVNTQKFIDVDETIDVKAGMSKKTALETLGPPKEVRAGIKTSSGDVVEKWLYDHKTQQFEVPAKLVNNMKVNKSQKPQAWTGTQTFEFIFVNDKLVKWGHDGDDWDDVKAKEGDGEVQGPDAPAAPSSGGLLSGGGDDSGGGGGILGKLKSMLPF